MTANNHASGNLHNMDDDQGQQSSSGSVEESSDLSMDNLPFMKSQLDHKASVLAQSWVDLSTLMDSYQAEVASRVGLLCRDARQLPTNFHIFNLDRKLKYSEAKLKLTREALAQAQTKVALLTYDKEQFAKENSLLQQKFANALSVLRSRGIEADDVLQRNTSSPDQQPILTSNSVISVHDDKTRATDGREHSPRFSVIQQVSDTDIDSLQEIVSESTAQGNTAYVLHTDHCDMEGDAGALMAVRELLETTGQQYATIINENGQIEVSLDSLCALTDHRSPTDASRKTTDEDVSCSDNPPKRRKKMMERDSHHSQNSISPISSSRRRRRRLVPKTRRKRRAGELTEESTNWCSTCNQDCTACSCQSFFNNVSNAHACDKCGRVFSLRTLLMSHLKTHYDEGPTDRFACNCCPRKFFHQIFLDEHKKQAHLRYKCGSCDKQFRNTVGLVRHFQEHSNETTTCVVCGSVFKNKGALRLHMSLHKADSVHACSYCGACFAVLDDLRSHSDIHNKDINYQCEVCSAAFDSKSCFVHHLDNAHNEYLVSNKTSV